MDSDSKELAEFLAIPGNKERLAASMASPSRCGGLGYFDLGPHRIPLYRSTGHKFVKEVGVLLNLEGQPLFWHDPNGSSGYLPDSRQLWEVLWQNRAVVSGFAHSHPGSGEPGPSHEDVTTFAAIEDALGRRLDWWIVTKDSYALFRWDTLSRFTYKKVPDVDFPLWADDLRCKSAY